MKKLTFEHVFNYFKDQNCKLLETKYVGARTLIDYKCSCGNESKITFNDFQKGSRCIRCSGKEKLTVEHISTYFTDHGCELLETEYINVQTLMDYKCVCGNESVITFNNFQQGKRCRNCYKNNKPSLDYVFGYFKDHGCELLETEYVNSKTSMKYICVCGNESKIRFNNFQQGNRCRECFKKRMLSH